MFSYVYAGDNPSDLGYSSGLLATPPQSGSLLTANGNFENNVVVGSVQWNFELSHGAKVYGGLVGANGQALTPSVCGGMAAVCELGQQGERAALSIPWKCIFAGPAVLECAVLSYFGVSKVLQGLGALAYGTYNIVAGEDLATLTNAHASGADKFLAVVDLASNAIVFVPFGGTEVEASRVAEKLALEELHGATEVTVHELSYADAFELDVESGGCGCFPGATGVLTPHGLAAIASLDVGDLVMAEDPATGKVEPEKVKAVIDDGIRPLMQVRLRDGSSLSVTTNHPFFVDSGTGIATPAWVQAGDLRVGDRIRTASGQDVSVVALRYHTGQAHVYTLTVAADHDFFVGSAAVLVHNSSVCRINAGELPAPDQQAVSDVMNQIANNTRPPGKLGDNWGAAFKNLGGDLPTEPLGYYHEYTALPPGATQRGLLRVVTGGQGEVYFTWTHYGKTGAPAFVQVR